MSDLSYLSLFSFSNPVVLCILLLAIFCYSMLMYLILFSHKCEQWYERASGWSDTFPALLSALPLLGLLGTIAGLLETFRFMSYGRNMALQELISNGIADALFTTQLGLLLVVPGWLLLMKLNNQLVAWCIEHPETV
ncbi:MotA/TolQ/ExbB proton channel family protein [Teredinibacter sp. KSP-S5-2]|uniref:MotA/TolQ/ExbB proton channel family protein n=1 Tax=Teredinibacter sp. KSP-S5-2 TaxID=3034506 RepID=UPI00293524D5|nr:MotA/TolQ/ExbB proton channel family protein [Teredinibacter sp. KSP-S5-2]WNO10333.1 MotA/TolQ/ExbB proton channel family protein [Teredinibacter sp. KSP-S5-2]